MSWNTFPANHIHFTDRSYFLLFYCIISWTTFISFICKNSTKLNTLSSITYGLLFYNHCSCIRFRGCNCLSVQQYRLLSDSIFSPPHQRERIRQYILFLRAFWQYKDGSGWLHHNRNGRRCPYLICSLLADIIWSFRIYCNHNYQYSLKVNKANADSLQYRWKLWKEKS